MAEASRRDFLKLAGLTAATVGTAAAFGAGLKDGADPANNTGWETSHIEYFDRRPFEIDQPKYKILGELKRCSYLEDRNGRIPLLQEMNFDDPTTWPIGYEEFYRKYPEKFDLDRELIDVVLPRKNALLEQIRDDFILYNAFFGTWGSALRESISVNGKPEVWDFEGLGKTQYQVTDPAEMTKLIKMVGRLYGSALVRVAKYNPAWSYDKCSRAGRGYELGEDIVIPDHWQYAIVVGVPHEWNQARANPTFGSSSDAYNRASVVAERLTHFIKRLGYPARPHSPDARYEVILPPILVDAGVGEQGRHGFVVTPEFGSNFRPAVITTNLPLQPDKPIDIGVREFCMKCMVCAETCPSASISFDPPGEIRGRGAEGWMINIETCSNYWRSVPSGSCRICLISCPYSKRSGWIHTAARDLAVRDKTGVVASALVWMERNFYGQHDPAHYQHPNFGVYREKPWWFETDAFLEVD